MVSELYSQVDGPNPVVLGEPAMVCAVQVRSDREILALLTHVVLS